MELLIWIASGLLIGVFSGFFGVGGGTISIPLLTVIFGFSGYTHEGALKSAIATSLLIGFSASLFASFRNAKIWRPQVGRILTLAAGSLLGTRAGVLLSVQLPGTELSYILGTVLLAVSLYYFFSGEPETGKEPNARVKETIFTLVPAGFVIGVFSGLTGMGGGVILIPALTFLFGEEPRRAAVTSSYMIILTTIFGVIQYGMMTPVFRIPEGYTHWGYLSLTTGIPVAVMAAAGGYFGARLLHRTASPAWKKSFAVILILVVADLFFFGI